MMSQPATRTTFELPFGYVENDVLHRQGVLRLPTQKDMISVFKLGQDIENPAYLEALLLACMLVTLEGLDLLDFNRRLSIIEQLVQPDVDYLNSVYQTLAGHGHPCPACGRAAEIAI